MAIATPRHISLYSLVNERGDIAVRGIDKNVLVRAPIFQKRIMIAVQRARIEIAASDHIRPVKEFGRSPIVGLMGEKNLIHNGHPHSSEMPKNREGIPQRNPKRQP